MIDPSLRLGPPPDDLIWASGIEDTFVPQTRRGQRALDEYELMGHYKHWREDLALAREVGVHALRWGVPWYRVEPRKGKFDWSWTDQVIPYLAQELGILPIIDLMHYGCPYWLEGEFASPEYPEAVAAYAAAFARRYSGLVHWYTPLNEPLITALMCGQNGAWPPYLRGDKGYVRVLLQVVKGILATVRALKSIDSNTLMAHVEAAGLWRTARRELEALAVEHQRRGYLTFDLLTGCVTPDHPLFPWLVHHGARPEDLAAIARSQIPIDVMGLNFYPQWSTKQVDVDGEGRIVHRVIEKEGDGFRTMISDYYRRYGAPVMVTETSAFGSDVVRSRWLAASVSAVKSLRSEGVPVIGYTWFPLFTMVKWDYRCGKQPLEDYYFHLGLYRRGNQDSPRWTATPLVEQLRGYIENAKAALGNAP